MFDLASVKVDGDKLHNGVWWEVHREPDGTIGGTVVQNPTDNGCLLIVPMGSVYERALEEARKPYLPLIRADRITDEDARDIMATALSAAVLRDWCNILVQGKPLPYSQEQARQLLAAEQWLALREFVIRAAQHRGSVLALEEEQAKGN